MMTGLGVVAALLVAAVPDDAGVAAGGPAGGERGLDPHRVGCAGNAEYVVMWLDNTATTNFAAEGVGHEKPDGERIPFVWRFADGSGIRNTFAYDRERDTGCLISARSRLLREPTPVSTDSDGAA